MERDAVDRVEKWLDNCLKFNEENPQWLMEIKNGADYRQTGIDVLCQLRRCQQELYWSALEHKNKEQVLFSDFMAMMITARAAQREFVWWQLWVCYFISLGRGEWQQLWNDVDVLLRIYEAS